MTVWYPQKKTQPTNGFSAVLIAWAIRTRSLSTYSVYQGESLPVNLASEHCKKSFILSFVFNPFYPFFR